MPLKKIIHEANFRNRTIWTGDNLGIMRGMNSASVDLIYLDPPFNSKADYAAPVGSKAAGAAFKDTWTLSDVDVEWINLIESKYPVLHRVLLAAMTNSDKSYLVYMAIRLLEMKRLLKDTGSIYLHCDQTMSHYLKLMMDAIFGKTCFQNEIIWQRSKAKKTTRRYPRNTDSIMFYTMSGDYIFDPPFTELSGGGLKPYRHQDDKGLYKLADIAKPGPGGYFYDLGVGEKAPAKGYRMPESTARKWMDDGTLVVKPGKVPARKRYLSESMGAQVPNLWNDIDNLQSSDAEQTHYPTQKPLALLERVIRTSSDEESLVFDPFCGCATTLVAADRLQRKWAGIDISPTAVRLVKERISYDRGMEGLIDDIIPRTDIPQRTDLGKLPSYNSPANRKQLYGEQGGNCAGCGEHFETRHLEIDHIISRSKGGTDHIENLQLLCGSCNRIKGDRGMEYLRVSLQL